MESATTPLTRAALSSGMSDSESDEDNLKRRHARKLRELLRHLNDNELKDLDYFSISGDPAILTCSNFGNFAELTQHPTKPSRAKSDLAQIAEMDCMAIYVHKRFTDQIFRSLRYGHQLGTGWRKRCLFRGEGNESPKPPRCRPKRESP